MNRPKGREPFLGQAGLFKCGVRISECGMENQNLLKCKRTTNESDKNRIEGNLKQNYLKERTKRFALEIIKLVEKLPEGRTADILGRQLLPAGTSAGANYRAACRARSSLDFISKMGIVEEEADESIYWMELLIDRGLIRKDNISHLLDEASQILAMTVSSIETARIKKQQ